MIIHCLNRILHVKEYNMIIYNSLHSLYLIGIVIFIQTSVCLSLTVLSNLLEACRFHTSFPSVLLKRSHKSHHNLTQEYHYYLFFVMYRFIIS